jgi:galactokinase/mevalonate kinase-like predicted kinase
VNDEIENFNADRQKITPHLSAIKRHNAELYKTLYQKKINDMLPAIGSEMNQSWKHHKQLSGLIGRGILRDIEVKVRPLTYGLRGPGAAGNSLFLLAKPESKQNILAYLSTFGNEVTVLYPRVNQDGLRVDSTS